MPGILYNLMNQDAAGSAAPDGRCAKRTCKEKRITASAGAAHISQSSNRAGERREITRDQKLSEEVVDPDDMKDAGGFGIMAAVNEAFSTDGRIFGSV